MPQRDRTWSAALWRLDARDERVEQGHPCWEDVISCNRPDVLERADPCPESLAVLLPRGLKQFAGSAERERQEFMIWRTLANVSLPRLRIGL